MPIPKAEPTPKPLRPKLGSADYVGPRTLAPLIRRKGGFDECGLASIATDNGARSGLAAVLAEKQRQDEASASSTVTT